MKQEHLVVSSRLDVLNQVQYWFKDVCHSSDTDTTWVSNYVDRLTIALTEGFTNAVRHAHAELPPDTTIDIDLSFARDRIEIRIWDHGQPFNPEELQEPEPGALLEGGYGWFLLRRLADRVTYQRVKDGRNCLSIVQYGT
ncbi:MAG: anti-sigma regulatory factor [Cyanobacteria bacterium Co-bin13]|nr:anti-sigma regulatory factor [Cyanobacteria bacterium Co-bin13]